LGSAIGAAQKPIGLYHELAFHSTGLRLGRVYSFSGQEGVSL
jgi:hypothetical protein